MKKSFITLGIIFAVIVSTTAAAMAYSTVYTDEIGRHHFLGKDPGAKSTQAVNQYTNVNNSKTKEFNDVNIKTPELNDNNSSSEKVKKHSLFNKKTEEAKNETKVNNVSTTTVPEKYTFGSKEKPSYSSDKYHYDQRGVNDTKTIYTDDIGRMHFFTKDAKTTY